jgi:hypothetical protein
LKDVQRLLRRKMYWPKLLIKNFYGALHVGALLWSTTVGILGKARPNWYGITVAWIVFVCVLAWAIRSTKKSVVKGFSAFNASLPDWVCLDERGIKFDGPNGATSFQPWQNFRGWHDGGRVVLIDKTGGGFVILSIGELPMGQRDSVRQFIRSRFTLSGTSYQNAS